MHSGTWRRAVWSDSHERICWNRKLLRVRHCGKCWDSWCDQGPACWNSSTCEETWNPRCLSWYCDLQFFTTARWMTRLLSVTLPIGHSPSDISSSRTDGGSQSRLSAFRWCSYSSVGWESWYLSPQSFCRILWLEYSNRALFVRCRIQEFLNRTDTPRAHGVDPLHTFHGESIGLG